MNNPVFGKIKTIIANSSIKEEQKIFLENFLQQLPVGKLSELLAVFESNSRAIKAYADFVKQLPPDPTTLSKEKLQEILTEAIRKST